MNKLSVTAILFKLSFASICTRPEAKSAFKETATALSPSGIDLPTITCLPEFLFDGLRLSEDDFIGNVEQNLEFPDVVDVSPHAFGTTTTCTEESMADAFSCTLHTVTLNFGAVVTLPHGLLSKANLPVLRKVFIDADSQVEVSDSLLTGNELQIDEFSFTGPNLVDGEKLVKLVGLLRNAERIALLDNGLTGSDFYDGIFNGFNNIELLRLGSNTELLCGETEAAFRSRTGLRSEAIITGAFTNSCA
eukprot:snap_masked-scaffold_9-processed-gene-12.17-mRNA-1 protein AED:1.00 eAED:1.00 QI:0/-1/0/0/-1/1/1/0/247